MTDDSFYMNTPYQHTSPLVCFFSLISLQFPKKILYL